MGAWERGYTSSFSSRVPKSYWERDHAALCDGAANLSGHYCMHRGLLLYEGVLARAGKTVPLVSSTF